MQEQTSQRPSIPDSERMCADRLAELRWPAGMQCECGGASHRRISTRPRVFVCRKCQSHTSVTAGTLMHGCHVPMRHWFVAASLIGREGGVSATRLSEILAVSYETAWQLLHRLRSALSDVKPSVTGNLASSMVGIRCGRPYRDGGTTRFLGQTACVAAVVGQSGAALEHVRHQCRVSKWIEETLERNAPIPTRIGPAMALLTDVWQQVVHTHAGVSELWLRRYVAESQFRANFEAGDVMSLAIAGRRSRFEQLRPKLETWGFDRDWLPLKNSLPLWRPMPRAA